MAKRSDIEAQIAALQADLESADTDDEIWIKEGDREFKVTGKRATGILDRFKDLWSSEETSAEAAEEEETAETVVADKKPSGGGYFGARGK